jgi:hypothetical protein
MECLPARLGHENLTIEARSDDGNIKSVSECVVRSVLARLQAAHPANYHKTEQDVWWIWAGAWGQFLVTLRNEATIRREHGSLRFLPAYLALPRLPK